jgi:deoxyuridine 5'-triphosphate nucleotidohydrolase
MTFGFYKLFENAIIPSYGTDQSACFDIAAHLMDEKGVARTIKVVTDILTVHPEYPNPYENTLSFNLQAGYTALIPTGLIAKIPQGYSLRTHVRSGIAMKRGLYLPNGEGIIDSDYFDELFLMVKNASKSVVSIKHGERICQGEWVPVLRFPIEEIHTRPEQTTNRAGGFGSTGV